LLTGLIVASLISTNCYAQGSVAIQKGNPAPFTGVLFTKTKAIQIKNELIERDQFKIFNKVLLENSELQQEIINNQKKQVDILLKQNDNLVNIVERTEARSKLARITWFGLGVVSAGLAVYGASLLVK
jgi:hypothetical protein